MLNKPSLINTLSIFFLVIIPELVIASNTSGTCYFSFGNPVQTFSQTGAINFACGATVNNTINGILATASVINPTAQYCANTCDTANCLASGIAAPNVNLNNFPPISATENINIANNQTYTFSTEINAYNNIIANPYSTVNFPTKNKNNTYYINSLQLAANATLNLIAGDYWINQLNIMPNAIIKVKGGGTAKIYLNESTVFGKNANINISNEHASSANLFIYSYNNLTFDTNINFAGFVYAAGNVNLNTSASITGAILANNISLQTSATVNYDPDAVKALDIATLCPNPPSLPDHFEISTIGNTVFCANNTIQVSANYKNTVATDYTGTIILNTGTGTGNWTAINGKGFFSNVNPNSGIAAYTFAATDNGIANFILDYSSGPASIDLQIYDENNPDITLTNKNNKLNFDSIGFVFTNSNLYIPVLQNSNLNIPVPNNLKTDPKLQGLGLDFSSYSNLLKSYDLYFKNNLTNYAYKDPQIAGISNTLSITAFGQTDGYNCRIIHEYTGNKNLKFWQDYVDPITGNLVATINNLAIGDQENHAPSQTINFTNGTASVNFLYRDVGKIRLNANDPSTKFTVDNNFVHNDKQTFSGSSSDFVVKPAKFILNVPNNPAATNETEGIFVAAGDPFSATVTVTDNDGNITPNYGNEINPAGLNIYSDTLVSPTGGYNGHDNQGTIINGSDFNKISPGFFQGTQFQFNEVGIIKLTTEVAGKNYLGAGNISTNNPTNIGRFTPNHFSITANTPQFNTTCPSGNFSYIGQKFKYLTQPTLTIIALSNNNTVTKNYTGNFFKLNKLNLTPTYSSSATAVLNSTAASLDLNLTDNADGTASLTFGDGGGLNYTKIDGQDLGPFNAEIQLATTIIDSDNIKYHNNPFTLGSTTTGNGITFSAGKQFYQGRMTLINNFGSELMPLIIPIQIQYFNGTTYTLNTKDSCTIFNDPKFLIIKPSKTNLITTVSIASFNNGLNNLTLSPPQPSKQTGVFNLEANLSPANGANLDYLQHNWPYDGNSDGKFDDNPQAQATFGIYHGNDHIIYMREITN